MTQPKMLSAAELDAMAAEINGTEATGITNAAYNTKTLRALIAQARAAIAPDGGVVG